MALVWPPTTHNHVTDQALLRHGQIQGNYYTAAGSMVSTVAGAVNRVSFTPVFVPVGTVDRLVVRVTTAAAAASGALVRLGMYDTTTSGLPGSLLVDGGTQPTETTGPKEVTVSVPITAAGIYWLAAVPQVVTATMAAVAEAAGSYGVGHQSTADMSNGIHAMQQASVAGALPATATPVGATVAHIRVWYRQTP